MSAEFRIISHIGDPVWHLKPVGEDRSLCELDRHCGVTIPHHPVPDWETYPPGMVILLSVQAGRPICSDCLSVFEMREELTFVSESLVNPFFEFEPWVDEEI